MDTGRLTLKLCEAVVEEHSQPDEVKKTYESVIRKTKTLNIALSI